jgi:hypothetical protein
MRLYYLRQSDFGDEVKIVNFRFDANKTLDAIAYETYTSNYMQSGIHSMPTNMFY